MTLPAIAGRLIHTFGRFSAPLSQALRWWHSQPIISWIALIIALALALFFQEISWIIPLLSFFIYALLRSAFSPLKKISLLLLLPFFLFYWNYTYTPPEKSLEPLPLTNILFTIEQLSQGEIYNKPRMIYRITLIQGQDPNTQKTIKEVKGLLHITQTPGSIPLDPRKVYSCQKITVLEMMPGYYLIKPFASIIQTNNPHLMGYLTLARYHAKKSFNSFLSQYIDTPREKEFLRGVLSGEYSDPFLVLELRRIGLQHLLAVSGFHFALMAHLFLFVFCLILPWRSAYWLIWVLLTLYALFIGYAPSVLRAYVAFSLYLGANLLSCRSNSLSNLATAFFLQIFIDPWSIFQLGFQFSYLATLAILLFQGPIENLLSLMLPTQKLKELLSFPLPYQFLYILSILLRRHLSLALGIFMLTTPLVLGHFGIFNLLSIGYNLIIPFLTSFLIYGWIIIALVGLCGESVWTYGFRGIKLILNILFDLIYHQPLSLDLYLANNSLYHIAIYSVTTLSLLFLLQYPSKDEIPPSHILI